MTAAAFDLLPPNATPYERGLARGTRRLIDVPTPIAEAFRPYDTPASVLPFLAWERSVDIWEDDWSETRKRNVTARAFPLHKRKGTAYAIREYVRYAGGEVTKIVAPPQRVFSGPSLTREEREAWLSKLPQVRTWRVQERWNAPRVKSFYGSRRNKSFFAGKFAIASTALQRLKRRARWVVSGVETDTRVSDFGSYFRLHLRAPAGLKVFSGKPFARRFFVKSNAWRRLVTIQPQTFLPWRSPVGPSLQAVTSEPERVKVRGTRGKSVFSGQPLGGFFKKTTATLRIFERYAVNDGSRQLKRSAHNFMGHGFYGFPAHTAKISVSIPGKLSPLAAGHGFMTRKAKFWMRSDAKERVERVTRAIRSAKRLSDKILLRLGRSPRFIAGNPFLAGNDFIVGQT